jgi:hypothetical protein
LNPGDCRQGDGTSLAELRSVVKLANLRRFGHGCLKSGQF